jgi:hypothetical protein
VVDIFDEVDEDLRAERAARLLKRHAGLIMAVAAAIVGGAAAWQLWGRYQARQDLTAAQLYAFAQSAADQAGAAGAQGRATAIAMFDQQAATAPEGYRTLSRLRAAALKADAGDLPGAIALWDQVAADSAADRLLRDLASLIAVQHQIDKGDPAQLEARLKPLASPDNPWSAMAREQLALLDLRQGKVAEATSTLRALSEDLVAPTGVRQRAVALLTKLGAEPGE